MRKMSVPQLNCSATWREGDPALALLFRSTEMKRLLIIAGASLFVVTCAWSLSAKGKDDLHLNVRLTTGEHSRDSSSETATITVERNTIVWEKTFSGGRRRMPSLRREFRLSSADKKSLLQLIRSSDLLVTDSIELGQDGSNFRYFAIAIDTALDGKTGAVKISGKQTAVEVKEEKLFQNALALLKELYRIISAQDESVHFEELIREPRR